jgi:hypothetical protein
MITKLQTFLKTHKDTIHDLLIVGKVFLYQVMFILMVCGVLYLTNFTVQVSPRIVSPIVEEGN